MQLVPIQQEPSDDIAAAAAANEAIAQIVEATVDLYRRRGYAPPWIGYLAREDDAFVGTCGFASPPADGEVEIAYGTLPGNERRGVATRMAKALMDTARPFGADLTFIAHTLPQEGPSTTILRKLGFELLGTIDHPEDGPVWKWRERRA